MFYRTRRILRNIAPSDYWLFRRMQQVIGSLRRNRKLDRLQRRVIFSRIAWEMEKVVGSDGQL